MPNRRQFKHVLIGPQLEHLSDDEYFPSIRDAVNAGDADLAGKTIEKVAGIIKKAAARLVE
jgi:N-acetylated-alpha-linked acidic dipeptidase